MHIITFDIEDWFLPWKPGALPPERWNSFESRVEQNVGHILELLGRHNQRATFFVLGWIAEKYPSLVRNIARAGHEIGFHSYGHQHLWMMQHEELAADFNHGLSVIQDLLGSKVLYYRAPFFSFNNQSQWAFEQIAAQGFVASSSTLAQNVLAGKKIPNEPFMLKKHGDTLHEFPLNRLNLFFYRLIFSGSGYFRIIPGFVLKTLFSCSKYNNTYFHPRDFDTAIPYSKRLSLLRNVFNTVGAKSTERKLAGLMGELHFMPLGEALEKLTSGGHDFPVLEI